MFNIVQQIKNLKSRTLKLENAEGTIISDNTKGHLGEYLKLFTVNFNTHNYKTNTIYFKLTDVQGLSYDSTINLYVHKINNSEEITNLYLKEINRGNKYTETADCLKNIVAVVEDYRTVSLYYKVQSEVETPTIKILSYQKYKNEFITMYSEEYVTALPDGTEYEMEVLDTGWLDLPLKDGITVGSIKGVAQYRKIGKTVYLKGDVAGISSGSTTIATLPSGFRPSKNIYNINATSGVKYTRLYVNSSGNLVLEWVSDSTYGATWYNIDMSFTID